MNIDLFTSGQSEAALVCAGTFEASVMGVILDAQTSDVTIEFGHGHSLHLNIPMEEAYKEKLLFAHRVFIGHLEGGLLMDSIEVPLLYLNDPYGSTFGDSSPLAKPARSIPAFEAFMRRCRFAQALHRDNLGDERSARSVLMGVDPSHLKYAPSLMRQIQMNATPKAKASPSAPALGNGSGATIKTKNVPPKDAQDEGK